MAYFVQVVAPNSDRLLVTEALEVHSSLSKEAALKIDDQTKKTNLEDAERELFGSSHFRSYRESQGGVKKSR